MQAKNILVVEDDTFTRELYDEVLKAAGYNVEIAADGEQGLVKAKAGGFDLILVDIMMPKLDGLGVLAELKKTPPQKPNGAIVMLTNLSHDPVVNQAMSLGAKACLVKIDLDPGQLVEKVKTFLGE